MPDAVLSESYRPFRLEITGTLRLLDPLHISTGERLSLSTDAPVLLDHSSGLPYIPATSLRGVLRDHLEREAALLGCSSSLLDALFGLTPRRRRDEASWAGRLTVFDCYPAQLLPSAREVRDHVRLHRSWGAADPGAKFDNEVALPADDQTFTLRLVYEGDSDKDPELVLVQEIVQVLLSGHFRLGAKTGWGYGQVQLDPPRYQVYDRSSTAGLAAYFSVRLGSAPSSSDSFAWPSLPGRPRSDARRAPFSVLLFRLRLHFDGPVLVKAPIPPMARAAGNINDPATYAQAGLWEADHVFLHRSTDNAQYLPGSSLRGVLRSQAERIDSSLATEIANRLFGWAKSSGDGGRRGVIEVGDGVLHGSPELLFLDHVAIDRITAAAVDAKKFSLSLLWPVLNSTSPSASSSLIRILPQLHFGHFFCGIS